MDQDSISVEIPNLSQMSEIPNISQVSEIPNVSVTSHFGSLYDTPIRRKLDVGHLYHRIIAVLGDGYYSMDQFFATLKETLPETIFQDFKRFVQMEYSASYIFNRDKFEKLWQKFAHGISTTPTKTPPKSSARLSGVKAYQKRLSDYGNSILSYDDPMEYAESLNDTSSPNQFTGDSFDPFLSHGGMVGTVGLENNNQLLNMESINMNRQKIFDQDLSLEHMSELLQDNQEELRQTTQELALLTNKHNSLLRELSHSSENQDVIVSELEHIKTQLNEAKKETGSFRAQNITLKLENQDLRDTIIALEDQTKQLKDQIINAATSADQLTMLSEEKASLEVKMNEIFNLYQDEADKNASLDKILNKKNERIVFLESQLQQTTEQYEELKILAPANEPIISLETLNKSNAQTQHDIEMEDEYRDFLEIFEKMTKETSENLSSTENKLKSANLEISELKYEIRKISNEKQSQAEKLDDSQTMVKSLSDRIEKMFLKLNNINQAAEAQLTILQTQEFPMVDKRCKESSYSQTEGFEIDDYSKAENISSSEIESWSDVEVEENSKSQQTNVYRPSLIFTAMIVGIIGAALNVFFNVEVEFPV